MTFFVLWRGIYRDEYDTFEQARKHALLALSTAPGWTPTQRKLHPEVRIVGDAGQQLASFSVAGELERLKPSDLTADK